MAFIQRELLEDLRKHLVSDEISLIVGPRQVGKTTLMFLLKEELDKKGEKTLFLSLDIESQKHFFESQNALIRKIELEFGKSRGYVFIDEIQRKENAGLFLKGIYDLRLPYKFVVSGSGSMELKEKIHESLMGRKRVFELAPVSFREFINFKTDYQYSAKLKSFFEIEKRKMDDLFFEYLNFGGYPRVVLAETLEEKRRIMDEILRSYLEKDISYLLKVERIDAFGSLIKILASQIGNLINYSEISSTLGITLPTVKNYFWYAEKTFVIQRLTPFFRNARKEISKAPIVYFYDLGLRNYSLGLFGFINRMSESGFIFENLAFNILKEKFHLSGGSLHFWRTKDGAEIDFVVNFGKESLPIEVKFKELRSPEIGRSMRSFIEKYRPKEAWVVNLNFRAEIRVGNAMVKFLPFYELVI